MENIQILQNKKIELQLQNICITSQRKNKVIKT